MPGLDPGISKVGGAKLLTKKLSMPVYEIMRGGVVFTRERVILSNL